jgi:hypothetical protein
LATHDYDRAAFLQRHEFDLMQPFPGIDAGPATEAELYQLLTLGREAIPGLLVTDEALLRVSCHNPESIFAIRRQGRLIGGIAYLFLTAEGLTRLLADDIDFADPDLRLLTPPGVAPAAIYIWACAARGRASVGLGTPATRLREEPYARADYYARGRTDEGARFIRQLQFEPVPDLDRDLWIYRRRCNRTGALPSPVEAHAAPCAA